MGTVDIINFPLGGDSVGHTINFRRSSAIAVILSVDMKIETPCRNEATGHAAG